MLQQCDWPPRVIRVNKPRIKIGPTSTSLSNSRRVEIFDSKNNRNGQIYFRVGVYTRINHSHKFVMRQLSAFYYQLQRRFVASLCIPVGVAEAFEKKIISS